MNTQAIMITSALVGVLLSSPVLAGDDERRERHERRHHHEHRHAHTDVVYAQVIYVEPIYRVVRRERPRRECWSTESYSGGHDGSAGLVLGGVLGGVIGHNLSQGHNNSDAAVLAGTLLGATIGHDVGHSGGRPVTRTHCETRNDFDEAEEIINYRVKYRHTGRIYETYTDRHPGRRLRVTVNIDD